MSEERMPVAIDTIWETEFSSPGGGGLLLSQETDSTLDGVHKEMTGIVSAAIVT